MLQGPSVGNLQKIPGWLAWARLLLIAGPVVLVFSALLFASVWLTRRWILRNQLPLISVRAWPAVASLALVGSFVLLQAGQIAAIPRLAVMTFYSVGFWLLSWSFALASLMAGYTLIRSFAERHQIVSAVWWHCLFVTIANLLLLAYLASYGVIGLQTWSH
jgi:hypothetical protein